MLTHHDQLIECVSGRKRITDQILSFVNLLIQHALSTSKNKISIYNIMSLLPNMTTSLCEVFLE